MNTEREREREICIHLAGGFSIRKLFCSRIQSFTGYFQLSALKYRHVFTRNWSTPASVRRFTAVEGQTESTQRLELLFPAREIAIACQVTERGHRFA